MNEMDKLKRQSEQIDLANADANVHGYGWLLVSETGTMVRVSPDDVIEWSLREFCEGASINIPAKDARQ